MSFENKLSLLFFGLPIENIDVELLNELGQKNELVASPQVFIEGPLHHSIKSEFVFDSNPLICSSFTKGTIVFEQIGFDLSEDTFTPHRFYMVIDCNDQDEEILFNELCSIFDPLSTRRKVEKSNLGQNDIFAHYSNNNAFKNQNILIYSSREGKIVISLENDMSSV